jgi:hypothetical protein
MTRTLRFVVFYIARLSKQFGNKFLDGMHAVSGLKLPRGVRAECYSKVGYVWENDWHEWLLVIGFIWFKTGLF